MIFLFGVWGDAVCNLASVRHRISPQQQQQQHRTMALALQRSSLHQDWGLTLQYSIQVSVILLNQTREVFFQISPINSS